jgi:hypothetical protein
MNRTCHFEVKMKDKINNGGQAFPSPENVKNGWGPEYGMTLRDWFAGQALTGWIMGMTFHDDIPDKVASIAYKFADAMLKERKK